MKINDLAFVLCKTVSIFCLIVAVNLLPSISLPFLMQESLSISRTILFFSALPIVALVIIGLFLWTDSRFFSSFMLPGGWNESDRNDGAIVSVSVFKDVVYSILGLVLIILSLAQLPSVILGGAIALLTQRNLLHILGDLVSLFVKAGFGVWLYFGPKKLKEFKNKIIVD